MQLFRLRVKPKSVCYTIAMPKPKRELRNLTLRLPEELHARLEKEAEKNLRSLNNEIVLRLQESVKKQVK